MPRFHAPAMPLLLRLLLPLALLVLAAGSLRAVLLWGDEVQAGALQSQRFVLGGEDAISFLTLDGFNVNVEGTIEFSIERDQAALMTHQVGDMEDVLKKLILPCLLYTSPSPRD